MSNADLIWIDVFADCLEQGMTVSSATAAAWEWEEYLDMDATDRLWQEWDAVESIEAAGFITFDLSAWLTPAQRYYALKALCDDSGKYGLTLPISVC